MPFNTSKTDVAPWCYKWTDWDGMDGSVGGGMYSNDDDDSYDDGDGIVVLDMEKSARGAARRRARIISGASLPGMTIRFHLHHWIEMMIRRMVMIMMIMMMRSMVMITSAVGLSCINTNQ